MNRTRTSTSRFGTGLTLLELMAVIAIVAILATVAIPSFSEIIKDNRVASQHNELVALISFAKSEAVRRSSVTDVTLSSDGGGWNGEVKAGLETLRTTANTGVELELGATQDLTFTFNSRGYLGAAGDMGAEQSFVLRHLNCTTGSTRQQRTIDIFPSGQLVSKEKKCE
jgi:type IV fimbrial biogenesis protein FimT